MTKIRIVNGPYRGREKTLAEKPISIGRDAEAGIQILDRSASRFHAEVFPVGGMYFVRDLDSKNGTYVNDEKIGDEELLREGDVIKIGSTELIYEGGAALTDDDSSNRISYREDPDALSNTLEFRLDELSDISEPKEEGINDEHARSLRLLYQIGRMLSDGDPKEMKVLDYLVQSLPAESALIFRRESPGGKLVPSMVRTASPSIQPVISRSIVKKTFTENKALHISDAQADERFDRTASTATKNIRSVVCVPISVASHVRGVLYLSRGEKSPPFTQIDLELASAVAVQLGMAQHSASQAKRHRSAMWKAAVALVRALETRANAVGSGERSARCCQAIAEAMKLDAAARTKLMYAGLLHHLPRLCAPDSPAAVWKALEGVDEFDAALPLAKQLGPEGKPTAGEEDDLLDILAVAAALEARLGANPGGDVQAMIEEMRQQPTLDSAVLTALQGAHLDGSLYKGKGGT